MKNINSKSKTLEFQDDEIDLNEIIKSILRRKYILIGVSTFSLLIGILYANFSTPIWEGHFQIVIKKNDTSESQNTQLMQLDSIKGLLTKSLESDIKTKVKILESPSILKPIFSFVKSNKLKSGKNVSKWSFYSWKKNLNIELEDGTSVLEIKYRDEDKNIIIPVIEKISNAYQKYSGSKKKKSIAQGIAYVSDQIIKMDDQSSKSLTDFQKFAVKYGLANIDGLPTEFNNINNLKKNNPLENNFSRDNTRNRYQNQYNKLSLLEADLVEKSIIFKPQSRYIILLKKRIENLKSSLTKSPEILLEYRKLKNKAIADEQVFFTLQRNLISLKLEQAKQTNS